MRILLVSQMWPAAGDPDYGTFVAQVARELERRGNRVERAVVDRRGAGRAGDARMARAALRAALRHPPDVIFGHFLLPAGVVAAAASVASRRPLVLMAHGQDVRNAVARPVVRAATRAAVGRAHTTIFNSAYLRDQLPFRSRGAEVIDCGVDLDRFRDTGQAAAREAVGLTDARPPVFLFAGSLIERKNVVRLRDAFLTLGRGTLVLLGDGPLRGELVGRPSVVLPGRVPHADVARWMAAADVVCLPSVEEPLGQVLLEAMAAGRSVVATRVGGPREFVTPGAGVLVDPASTASIRAGLEQAASLPSPNPAARAAAEPHDVRRQVARMEAALRRAASAA